MHSYCHPGPFSLAVIRNKEAHLIYGNMNKETGSSQAGFHVKCKGQTETLTPYFKRKENIF